MIQSSRQDGPISVAKELRVEANHLYPEGNLVDYALAGTVAAAEQFKVGKLVEGPISIFVMDGLFGEKLAPHMALHDKAVFEHLAALDAVDVREADADISLGGDVSLRFSGLVGSPSCVFGEFEGGPAFGTTDFSASSDSAGGSPVISLLPFGRAFVPADHAGAPLTFAFLKPSALPTAVERVFAVLLPIASKLPRIKVERRRAPLAGKLDLLRIIRPTVDRLMGAVARGVAIFPVLLDLSRNVKSGAAMLAASVDGGKPRHGFISVFKQSYQYSDAIPAASNFALGV